jgi:hypothetical protein
LRLLSREHFIAEPGHYSQRRWALAVPLSRFTP